MANGLSCLNKLVGKPGGNLLAMRHVSHTFPLVNEKLAGQNAVTDLTIAVIVSMAQYEHHQNQYQRGFVHVQGLRRIAELRGGISQLIENSTGLVQKVLRYVQIEGRDNILSAFVLTLMLELILNMPYS